MDDAKITLALTAQAVAKGNLPRLKQLLARLPLEQLPPEDANALLVNFLNIAYANTQPETVEVLLEFWGRPAREDANWSLPIVSTLFTLPQLQDQILAWVIDLQEETTFEEVANDFIRWDAKDAGKIALNRAIELYRATTIPDAYPIFQKLHKQAVDAENIPIIEVLASYLADVSPFAPVPSWVKDFRPGEPGELPYEDELVVPPPTEAPGLPAPEEAAALLTESLLDLAFEEDEETVEQREVIRSQLAIATPEEKLALMAPILEGKAKEELTKPEPASAEAILIYRLLGPANLMVGANLADTEGDPEGTNYGGCRMFTCVHFEGDPDLDEESQALEPGAGEWFTGSCDQCYLRIRVFAHAVRMPLIHGGWQGCFHSWECVRQSLTKPDIAVNAMIDHLERQMERIGIQDRRARPPAEGAT